MLRKILAATIFMPLLVAGASMAWAQGYQEYDITPQELSTVNRTCSQVLGLQAGQTYFAACQESLSLSVAARNEDRAMMAAFADCAHRGLVPGAAGFSTCMLEGSKSMAAGPQRLTAVSAEMPTGGADMEAGKSFYDVSPQVRWTRERYACAQLGLLPGSAPFAQCVDGLEGSFLPRPN